MQETNFHLPIPKALLTGIQGALNDILFQNSFSDKAVANMLKNHTAWGSRDRKTATRITYDITRNFLKYQFIAQQIPAFSASESNEQLIHALIWISIYHDEILAEKLEVPEDIKDIISNIQFPSEDIRHSVLPWIYSSIKEDWGNETDALIKSLDNPAPVYIRYNSLKTTAQKLNNELDKLKIEYLYSEKVGGAIQILSNNQLRQTNPFKEGMFEFQDIGSQHIVKQAGIKPGQVVVDFCAGKGGKTLQIAGLMKNDGRLIASDIDATRLSQLQKRAQKAGIKNLELIPHNTLLDKKNLLADLVLIDAPCSGMGTFRRQPDLKFRLKKENLDQIIQTQAHILEEAKSLLRVNGKLVYATCSILKKENSQQIENFLKNNPYFELLQEEYILPKEYNGDGFYVAILKKNG